MKWFKDNFQYKKVGDIVSARVLGLRYQRIGYLWQLYNVKES